MTGADAQPGMGERDQLPTASPRQVRAGVAALARPRRGRLAVTALVLIAATGLELAGPALLGRVVDLAVTGASRAAIIRTALAFLAVTLGGAALAYLGMVAAAKVGEDVLVELRQRVFDRLVDLPLEVIERIGTGEPLSRVTSDVATLTTTVRTVAPNLAVAALTLALTLVALVVLSPILTAGVLASVPAIAAGARWYLRRTPALYRAERERTAALVDAVHESFDGLRTLLAFRREADHRRRIHIRADDVYEAVMAATRARNVLRPAVTAGQFAALATTLALGALLLGRGATSIGVVSAAALYLLRLFEPVNLLLELLDEAQTAQAALARLVGVLQLPPQQPPAPATGKARPRRPRAIDRPNPARATSAAPPTEPHLRLHGVRFAYRDGLEVLHGIDLDVAPRQRLVLVGPSGAGKTTIAKLAAGVHPPTSGQVTMGGLPLTALDPVALRRTVMLVTQETHVFTASLADNLRLAAIDAHDDELEEALGIVDALGWARSLPAGLATPVGAGGHRLSAGQIQQLSLARLILAGPPIVVLDEATAALDPASARRLERAVAAALAGRTVIAVSHRLDAAAHADRIAVVDAGRIIEAGTHHELLAAGGSYAQLWRRSHMRQAV